MMDISKLNKAEVLAALYNRAQTQGMGIYQYQKGDMTREQAQEMLDSGKTYFDYVIGRVMKVDLSKDEMDTFLYNRDNGKDAAEKALQPLLDAVDA